MKSWIVPFAAVLAVACTQAPPQISMHDAWARATLAGQQGAIYLRIDNAGGQDDRLLGVRTPRAAMAMLHSASSQGGVMRMREMDQGAAIPAHGDLLFKPGGNHIMLSGLARPLVAGEHFPLTLHFQASGDRHIDVAVLAAGASGPVQSQ